MTDGAKTLLRRLVVDEPSPLLKQLPTTVFFFVAVLVVLLFPPLRFTAPVLASASAVLIAVTTVLAWLLSRRHEPATWTLAVPLLDFVAIGAFRAATGGSTSIFTALILLPVVWVAAEPGRVHILVAAAGTSFALFLPYLLQASAPSSGADVIRAIFAPLVYACAAAIVNELARQIRSKLAAISQMAHDRERMLEESIEHARRLEASEAAYREADRMFRGVWAAVTEQAVIGTDVSGRIDAWNPGAARMLGRSARDTEDVATVTQFLLTEELDARADEVGVHGEEAERRFGALVSRAHPGEADTTEWTLVRADGTTFPGQVTVTSRLDEADRVTGYLFVATDATQAHEAARMKDEFVGLVSHELRTPLSSVLGYLELLRDDEEHPLTDEQLHYLAVAERNAHRLLTLVGELLFTAQVESGEVPLDVREVELGAVVRASVESAGPAASGAGVVLDASIASPAVLRGDQTRLGQACDNLISNALKFTRRGGTVNVRLGTDGTRAVLEVEDTGIGIPAAELDRLFSRFFRASSATRNAVPGVGLGLTITQAIVAAHGGTMSVESEEGVGTRFTATLPLAGPIDRAVGMA
ncbi:sensor histidine kinase [Humibacter sp.]|jgi:PAS domain S-box-containing protein|uniref:sensor histidine kinase n=1 Tax=Humibacter sp. TaxID=1940291 RepID=UPI002B9B2C73|nr:ATP-binding protein [Humibacter sp.]HVX07165.1 ATP-binding protein [Humibacter sp.]